MIFREYTKFPFFDAKLLSNLNLCFKSKLLRTYLYPDLSIARNDLGYYDESKSRKKGRWRVKACIVIGTLKI